MNRMNRVIDRFKLEKAISRTQIDTEQQPIRDSYSGRGMFGATCFGVIYDSNESLELMVALADIVQIENTLGTDDEDNNIETMDLARVARTDSIGLNYIIYFPGFSVEGDKA